MAETTRSGIAARAALYDSLFLGAIVLLSCVPYVTGLGLYGDDWAFFAAFDRSDGSFWGLYSSLIPLAMGARPVQALLLAELYWLFGQNPLAFHLANCAILMGAVLLFYHSLRLLGLKRLIALVVPLIFALLPHYSTDRFWIAAFQANASILLYFLSLYADLRFVMSPRGTGWLWKLLGTVAVVGSVLAYEVTAALLLVNMVVLLYLIGVRRHGAWVRRAVPAAVAVATNMLFITLAIGYKLTVTERAGVSGGLRFRLLRILTEAAPVHFGEYGIGMPLRVGRVLQAYPDAFVEAISLLVGAAAVAYLLLIVRRADGRFEQSPAWPAAMLIGGVLFCAGYGVTVMTWEIGFHMTGPNNRTAIGAAIGTAWVFAGAIGWISSRLRSEQHRWLVFACGAGLLAASSTLLTNTVASFWVSAARQQDALIAGIRQQFPELPAGTTLLLDGTCPFEGPAPVIVTSWDMTGILQLVYGDRSLRGDVLKPNSEVLTEGVRTMLFDDVINVYRYADEPVVLHVGTGETRVIRDIETARAYFAAVSVPGRADCPPYTDGDGAPIY